MLEFLFGVLVFVFVKNIVLFLFIGFDFLFFWILKIKINDIK